MKEGEKNKKTKNKKREKKRRKKRKEKKKGKEIKQTLEEMVTVPGTANPLSDSHKKRRKKKKVSFSHVANVIPRQTVKRTHNHEENWN